MVGAMTNNRTQVVMKSYLDDVDDMPEASPEEVEESLKLIEDLKFFLATAPVNWQENQIIRRYHLNNDQGFVSCVFWNNLYYVTGTDIVKCCMYRMERFGRRIVQKKKFEEGIFSDLRNLKCGIDATLEQPKSEFLQFLFRNSCLKTQKKQKVFYWFGVPHDKIFAEALERDLKREAHNQSATTKAVSEPSLSFAYNGKSNKALYDQLVRHVDIQRQQMSIPTDSEKFIETETKLENTIKVDEDDVKKENDEDYLEDAIEANMSVDQFKPDSPNLITTSMIQNDALLVSNIKEKSREESKEKTLLNDFQSEYFTFDIEYPDTKEQAQKNNILDNASEHFSGQDMYQTPSNPYEFNMLSPYQSEKRKYYPQLSGYRNKVSKSGALGKNMTSRDQSDQCDSYMKKHSEAKVTSTGKISTQIFTPQSNFNQSFTMMQAPMSAYKTITNDILTQTIEQPMIGFEGIYTPQRPYNNDKYSQFDNLEMGSVIQPQIIQSQLIQAQVLQPPPSATIINPFTPGFMPLSSYPWVQSPYMPLGTPQNITGIPGYYRQQTPHYIRRKPYQTSSNKIVQQPSRPNKVRKVSHSGPEIIISESKAALQDKIKESAKQLRAQILKKGLEKH